MELVDFLRARLDEDEAAANLAARGRHDQALDRDDWGRLLIWPERVLADVEAKRRLIDESLVGRTKWDHTYEHGIEVGLEWAVAIIATEYDTHPDYDESWRP
jgi:hypothetical protein